MTFRTVVRMLAPSIMAPPSSPGEIDLMNAVNTNMLKLSPYSVYGRSSPTGLSSCSTAISFVTDSMMMGDDAVPHGGCPARPGWHDGRAGAWRT